MTTHAQFSLPNILCCVCGVSIQPNPTNMCINCLHDRIDITEDINKRVAICSCRNCGRFLGPPWQELQLESKDLMIMCLRKIAGLNRVKLVDAVWVWTEPHSLRLKIKLTVQKEIMNGAVLQQATLVEFIIRNQQCKDCEANFAQGAWEAIVQVRQRVSHKRTFFYLEQLILKHHAHSDCVKIVTFRDGIDFYFKDKNEALRFLEFLKSNIPLKSKYSRKLISADHSDNTAEFKHNYLVEIVPLCKDDLVLLPRDLASKQSNISPLVLIKRIGASIYVVDPRTSERTDINSEKYWRHGFQAILTSRQLIKYVILSVEPLLVEQRPSAKLRKKNHRYQSNNNNTHGDEDDNEDGQQSSNNRKTKIVTKLAECVIARERDFGVTDTQFTCITHLGPLLQPGDTVLGYDLTNTNFNLSEDTLRSYDYVAKNLPDVILVRKCYEKKGTERNWTLKNLKTTVNNYEEDDLLGEKEQEEYDADREDFMQQIEGDKEMRLNVNLYKNLKLLKGKGAAASTAMETEKGEGDDDEDDEQEEYDDEEVRLDELLDDMAISAGLLSSNNGEGEIKVMTQEELKNISLTEESSSIASPNTNNNKPSFDSSPFEGKAFKFI